MDRSKPESMAPAERLPLIWLAAVAVYAASILTFNPGRPWALTFHEVNFAQPAREFLSRGDWIVPRIVGVPLWDKPPLMHWLIALSLGVFGTEGEWAARIPSTLSAVLVACLIALLGTRWHGRRVGVVAGLIQASCLYVLMQGRLAEADMLLCATVTSAMTALAIGTLDGPVAGARGRLLHIGFFGSAGLAFLAKGPLGLAFVGGGSGLYALVERRRHVWQFLLDPWGWALMIGLVTVWPMAALASDPGLLDVWWRHNVDRMSGKLGGQKDPFFYFYTIPWLLLPWTPFAFQAFRKAIRTRPAPRRAAEGRFLGSWFLAGLALLSLSAWKHKHYVIPILPPLSIVAACGFVPFVLTPSARALAWARCSSIGLMAAGLLGVLVGLATGGSVVSGLGLTGLVAGAGLAAFSTPGLIGTARSRLLVSFGTVWVIFVLTQAMVMPRFDLYREQSELARRTSLRVPPGADLSVVEIPDPQVVYYLRLPLRRHDTWESFVDRLVDEASPDVQPRYVVAPKRLEAQLSLLGQVRQLDRSADVHPRKPESERLTTFEVIPDSRRLASLREKVHGVLRR